MGNFPDTLRRRDDIGGLDVINIDNISNLEFSKLIGEYGYIFLLKYINEAKTNKEYCERIKNLKISFPYDRLYGSDNDKDKIVRTFFESIFFYKHLDKKKLIDAMGNEDFVYRFANLIALDIIYSTDENGILVNLPGYIEYIKNSDLLLSCVENIVINDSVFIERIMDKAKNIWGYLFKESHLESNDKALFDKSTGELINHPNYDEHGIGIYDEDTLYLSPLTDIDMANIAKMLKDFRDILYQHPLYPFIRHIAETNDYFNDEYSLDVFFMDSTLHGLIYFYDPEGEMSNLRSQGWLLDYIFYYEKDDRFTNYDDLFYYIIEMVDMP